MANQLHNKLYMSFTVDPQQRMMSSSTSATAQNSSSSSQQTSSMMGGTPMVTADQLVALQKLAAQRAMQVYLARYWCYSLLVYQESFLGAFF